MNIFEVISIYRHSYHLSHFCFQCEAEINSASQTLLTIGRRATECKTSEDASSLIKELEDFKGVFGDKQDVRLQEMEKIAVELWGKHCKQKQGDNTKG